MKKLFFTLPLVFVFFFSITSRSLAQEGTVSATVRPNPLEVIITSSSTAPVGEWFEVTAAVSNQGDIAVSKASATINLHSGIRVRGLKKRLGDLAPGEKKAVTWLVRANKPGGYVIQVEASGKLGGEEIFASDTAIISATGSLGAFFFRLIFGG